MSALERSLYESAGRLVSLCRRRGPRQVIDQEMKLLVIRIASLVGPEKVRGWVDEASERIEASLRGG